MQGFTDLVISQRCEEIVVLDLTVEHGEVSIRDTDDWEVFLVILLVVMISSPVDGREHRVQEVLILKVDAGITWDIQAIELLKLLLESLRAHVVVKVDHTGTGSLQKVHMTGLKEGGGSELQVFPPLVRDGLRQYAEDRLVRDSSSVVASLQDDGLALVTAQMVKSMALIVEAAVIGRGAQLVSILDEVTALTLVTEISELVLKHLFVVDFNQVS